VNIQGLRGGEDSVLNAPGPPHGPTRRLPRARDGTTKGGPFSSGKPQDGRPCNVRQIRVGDYGARRGTAGDRRVKFLESFNNPVRQTEVRTCVKDNKKSVILFQPLVAMDTY